MSLDNSVVESFLQAMDIISQRNDLDISYDKTINCQIVDNSNAKNGQYVVSYENSKFNAFSEEQKYQNKAWVRVLIPEGNMSNTKYIVGPVAEEQDSNPITYLSATNTILDIFELTKGKRLSGSLIANKNYQTSKNKETSIQLASFDISEDQWLSDVFSIIFIEANFKTSFGNIKNIINGFYGLKIKVNVKLSDTETIQRVFRFDSSEFFGNPYKFSISSNQAKKFNIKDYNRITKVIVEFYQTNNFVYWENGVGKILNPTLNPNLFVENVKVGFGSDLAAIEDNSVKLITQDSKSFYYTKEPSIKNLEFLWYNKTEENKYLGFSDGVAKIKKPEGFDTSGIKYDDFGVKLKNNYFNMRNYDEIEFLEYKKNDDRLIVHKSDEVPTDKKSLSLAADIDEADVLLRDISYYLQKELVPLLSSLKASLLGIPSDKESSLNDIYSTDIPAIITSIDEIVNGFEEEKIPIKTYYKNLLKYVAYIYKFYEDQPTTDKALKIEKRFPADFVSAPTAENSYKAKVTKIKTDIIGDSKNPGIFTKIADLVTYLEKKQKNYYRYWKKYESQYNSLKDKINTDLEKVEPLIPEKVEVAETSIEFNRYKMSGDKEVSDGKEKIKKVTISGVTTYEKYSTDKRTVWEPKDLSLFENLYCIYWYRYEKDYSDKNDPFGGENWKRITDWYSSFTEETVTDVNTGLPQKVFKGKTKVDFTQKNLGLPLINDEKTSDVYYWKPRLETSQYLSIPLDPQRDMEKIKVVVVYNHIGYTSNEIEFKNENHPNNLDRQDINLLEIENVRNSQDTYVCYDGTTKLLLDSRHGTLDREIKAVYKGDKTFKDAWEGGYISWYVPQDSTQLKYDMNKIEELGFKCASLLSISDKGTESYSYNDKNELIKNETILKPDKKEFFYYEKVKETIKIDDEEKEQTFYKIEKDNEIYLIPTSGADTRKCEAINKDGNKFNGMICFSKEIKNKDDLTFSYRIKDTYRETNNKNIIYCVITKNEIEYQNGKEFIFKSFGTNGTDYTVVVSPKDFDKKVFASESDDFYYLKVEVFDKDGKELDNIELNKVEFIGPSTYKASIEDGNIIRINLKSTAGKYTDNGVMKDKVHCPYYGILNIEISGVVEGITLSTQYPITWGKYRNYSLNGATSVVYNSLGANPLYERAPYEMYEDGDLIEDSGSTKVNWEILYLNKDGQVVTLITEKRYKILKGTKEEELKEQDKEQINLYEELKFQISIDAKTHTLKPPVLYVTGNTFYPVVVGKKSTVFCYQPLLIFQNQYESNLLNKWDGSLQIDEENNTILAAMVGAGVKNEDNTFSGVLMGDVGNKANIAESELGLYGFHHGGQSFGFKVDGTAFIGKAGAGRVRFDGNRGLIYSASWEDSFYTINKDGNKVLIDGSKPPIKSNGEMGQGTAGMAIDLKNGHIDAYNFKLTGKNLLIQTDPVKDDDYFRVGPDEEYIKFTKTGTNSTKLSIKVEDFSLTPSMGGRNLLNNTLPLNEIGEMLPNTSDTGWNFGDKVTAISSKSNGKKYIKIINPTSSAKSFSQNDIEILSGEKYCLSGQYQIRTISASTFSGTTLNKNTQYFLHKNNSSYLGYDQNLYQSGVSSFIIFEKLDEKKYQAINDADYVSLYQNNTSFYVKSGSNYYKISTDVFIKGTSSIYLPAGKLYQKVSETSYIDAIAIEKGTKKEINVSNLYFKYGTNKYKKCLLPEGLLEVDTDNKVKVKNNLTAYVLVRYKMVPKDTTLSTTKDKYCIRVNNNYKVLDQSKYSEYIRDNGTHKTFVPGRIYTIGSGEIQNSLSLSFTLSGEVATPTTKTVNNNWRSFKNVYDFSSKTSISSSFNITIPKESVVYLYQLQLEEGQNQTSWSMSLLDAKEQEEKNIELGRKLSNYLDDLEEEFNTSFTQQKLFATLSGGYNNMGIFMEDGYLFINANHIASGAVSSQNWLQTGGAVDDDGNILASGTAGMSISLTTGQIDAHNFELNAWNSVEDKGLFLNSNPGEDSSRPYNDYYLKLGDGAASYINFDKNGNLVMKVNTLEITGTLGGANLLNDTEPNGKSSGDIRNAFLQENGLPVDDFAHWIYNNNSVKVVETTEVYNDPNNSRKTIRIHNLKKPSTFRQLYQNLLVPLTSGKKYILSGWIRIGSPEHNDINFYLRANAGTYAENDLYYTFKPSKHNTWIYFSHIFEIPKNIAYTTPQLDIRDFNLTTFKENGDIDTRYYTYFYHLKLEEGTIATQWTNSEQDVKDYDALSLNYYDKEILTQTGIFNKLTNNGIVKGIWFQNNQLYINATYIGAGFLRSNTLTGTVNYTDGTKENLNSFNFEGESSKTIKDFSISGGTLFDLQRGILYATDVNLTGEITATKLTLSGIKIPTSDISGLSTIATSGKLEDALDATSIIWLGDITQKEKTDKNGFTYYQTIVPTINSKGEKTNITYATYNADNYIIFGREKTGTENKNNYFKISTDGLLTAKNAVIYGTIYATDGYFFGELRSKTGYIGAYPDEINPENPKDITGCWIIDSNRIENKTKDATTGTEYYTTLYCHNHYYHNNDATTKKAADAIILSQKDKNGKWSYPFILRKDGYLEATNARITGTITANSGTIGGCTINEDGVLQVGSANISGIDASKITSGTIDAGRISASIIKSKISDSSLDLIKISGKNAYIKMGDANGYSDGYMHIYASTYINLNTTYGELDGAWTFPSNVSAAAEMSVDSDFNKKNTINKLTDKYENLFNLLIPVTYKYNNGTSDRLHTGFIAQDVENALTQSNLTSQDFAGLVIDTNAETNEVTYRLRYGEFVSLNTWQIQKLKARVLELENKILELEAKL